MSTPKREKRSSKRRRIRLPVRFWNELGEHTGFSADISGTGLFVETNQTRPIATRLHLEIITPSGPFFCEAVVARILRASSLVRPVKLGGMGLRMVGLEEAIQAIAGGADDAEQALPQPAEQEIPARGDPSALELDLRDRAALELVFERDVKQAGLYVRTDAPPARDSQVVVRLLLPPPNAAIEVEGTVVQVMAQPRGVAVQLLDVDPLTAKLASILGR